MLSRPLNRPDDGAGDAGFGAAERLRVFVALAAAAFVGTALFAAALARFDAAAAFVFPAFVAAALLSALAAVFAAGFTSFTALPVLAALVLEPFTLEPFALEPFALELLFALRDFAMGQSPDLNDFAVPSRLPNQNEFSGPGIAIMRRFVMRLRGL
jgi:hypothetical protein